MHWELAREWAWSCIKARHLWKVANFNLPHLHLAPPLGMTPFEFCRDLRQQKTRIHGPSCGVVCVVLGLAVSVEHRLVTDEQTQWLRHTALAWRRAVSANMHIVLIYKLAILTSVISRLWLWFTCFTRRLVFIIVCNKFEQKLQVLYAQEILRTNKGTNNTMILITILLKYCNCIRNCWHLCVQGALIHTKIIPNKRLSYWRGIVQHVMSVKTLTTAVQLYKIAFEKA